MWRVGGQNCECTINTFIGAVDELAIYPRELLQSEVEAHFHASGR